MTIVPEVTAAQASAGQLPYVANCFKCAKPFNVGTAAWCECDTKLRTLVCPHCESCFCRAPIPYKRKFWNEAPRSLRESSTRFRLNAPSISKQTATPAVVILTPTSHKLRALVVDDEESIRSFAACYVEHLGFEVTTASDAQEGLLAADALHFDVVITDALMPKMDGREMCRRLKEAHGNHLKVVLMTSLYTAAHFKAEARHRFGVDEYLVKPLQLKELKAALDNLFPMLKHR